MYVRTKDTFERYPTSYAQDSSINGIGKPIRKPVLLTHYHVRKALSPGAGLLSDPTASVMTTSQMKPGFVDDSRRVNLQRDLMTLVRGKYSTAISPNVKLRIALVDMTEAKHNTPIFAGFYAWNPTNPGGMATMEGGSLTKILALYAVYQLRFDLNAVAQRDMITKGSVLRTAVTKEWKKAGLQAQPNLTGLFRFVERAGKPVVAELRVTPEIHSNASARSLIVALGFEFIGSVALQSGLFDAKNGGLWLNAAYGQPALTWRSSPYPIVPRHSTTAFAAVTYFTLLAQGRLGDQITANKIVQVLKLKCATGGLLDGIETLPGVIDGDSPNKCGILARYYHEAFHVVRQVPGGKRLRYAAAVLSQKPTGIDYKELGKDLDGLIAKQNP